MCGIAGIFAHHGTAAPVDRDELAHIRDHMAARGPDGVGTWYSPDGRVGFGHRRLSIIDLTERGSQPMRSADGAIVINLNGEIYNYLELRRELQKKGYAFRSDSDTEVLIHLYADRGRHMVDALRGMFAFGLWDARRRALLLARDPYGIKPLYYSDDGSTLRFASSVKALMAGGAPSRDPEPAGWMGFYLFGSVPEPFTTYRAVRTLPAGAILTIDHSGLREERYHSLAASYCAAEEQTRYFRPQEYHERFRAALLDSVRAHLVADVPVGAFLSSGVDSGSLVGLMRDAGQTEIRTVTLAFEEFRGTSDDEAPLADLVARRYGTRHTTRWVSQREFASELPNIVAAMDQPSIDGINTWFVSKAAREQGLKVAISGLGGDELLGGYSTFHQLARRVRWLGLASRARGHEVGFRHLISAARAFGINLHPKADGLVTYGGTYAGGYLLQRGLFLPGEFAALLDDERIVQDGLARLEPVNHIQRMLTPEPKSTFGKVATLESSLYLRNQLLRDADWAGMAHALEVRTPLVDAALLRRLAPMLVKPERPSGKTLLAGAPSLGLPPEVLRRRKTGFSIPVGTWSRDRARTSNRETEARPHQRDWARGWARHIASSFDGPPIRAGVVAGAGEAMPVPQTTSGVTGA